MNIDQHREILFSNFHYQPHLYYFLYCGDIKAYPLNTLLRETLATVHPHREVRFIAIVPDVLSRYEDENIIVINPTVQNENRTRDPTEPETSCRIPSKELMTAISNSPAIRELVATILTHQDELLISLFESLPEMTLDEISGVRIIGPDKTLARHFNHKITQYQELADVVPMAEHQFCDDLEHLEKTTARLRETWQDGIFISCAFSAAGANSVITQNQQQVQCWCQNQEGPFLISRFVPHTLDPTVLAVVANEKDVYIAGVADQAIEDGNRFTGSTYPSVVTGAQRWQLHDYTTAVGRFMGRRGYRGIFGCDYIIANDGRILFIEVNARKQGTTLEFCYTLEHALPPGSPLLPELEYYAVTANRFPPHTIEPPAEPRLCWGTYNYKLLQPQTTTDTLIQKCRERDDFAKVAQGELESDFVILEHIGSSFTVLPGTFLARVVSVATTRNKMTEGLRQGVELIQQTIHEAKEHHGKPGPTQPV